MLGQRSASEKDKNIEFSEKIINSEICIKIAH